MHVWSRGRVLRGILPVLAFVWATATWHDCYLAGTGGTSPSAGIEHCVHHPHALLDVAAQSAPDVPADHVLPSCDEVAKTAPDLRHAFPDLIAVRVAAYWPARFDERAPPRAASAAIADVPPPDTPLNQRPARLLI